MLQTKENSGRRYDRPHGVTLEPGFAHTCWVAPVHERSRDVAQW